MNIKYGHTEILLPDFLIVGAMRSGTTSLYNYLNNHLEVFMPSLKEPNFFSYLGERSSPHPQHIRKEPWILADYLELFKSSKSNQIVGEASASYLYFYSRTIENIRNIYGKHADNLKVIGVLRNPVDRAWSLYTLKKMGGDWKRNFIAIAKEFENTNRQSYYYNFLASGLYSKQIKAYKDSFPYTKFFLFEELLLEPQRVVQECLEFIGAENIDPPPIVGKSFNRSGVPRTKLLSPLSNFLFAPNRLKALLKRMLPENIRLQIKAHASWLLLTKAEIPYDVESYLHDFYKEDLEKVIHCFPAEKQKKIIFDWIR
jgi:hypothetical protein